MLLWSTTKPPILVVLTKNHISEAFRIDFVDKSMFLRSTTKPLIFSIGGGLTKNRSLWGGNRASVKIDSNICSPLQGGVSYEGGRSNQKSFLMRGVIVPPSKLIVTFPPPRGGFLLRGGDYIYIYIYNIYIYIYIYINNIYIYIYIYIHDMYIYIYIYYLYTYTYIHHIYIYLPARLLRVLGVKPSASAEEIKAAYRKQALAALYFCCRVITWMINNILTNANIT